MANNLYDTGVRPIVDDYLKKKSEEKRNYGLYWSASSAGYCMRKVIFERLGVPAVTEDPRKTRVFEAGHIFHKWYQDITKAAGISIAQELELQDENLMIRGHFDDLVLVEGNLILYDVKTAHSKWFERAKTRPMSHYNRMQLGTYMYMLRNNPVDAMVETDHQNLIDADRIADLTEARILKISKDDLRMHEIQLLWTPNLEKDVVSYWRTLNGYWENKKLPKCTCADYEKNDKTGIGFMALEKYNPYFYEGEPCSEAWYRLKKEEGVLRDIQ